MRNPQKTHALLGVLSAGLLLVTLAACDSGEPQNSTSPLPELGTSSTPEPSISTTPEFPSDSSAINAWAAERVPSLGSDGYIAGSSGELSESRGQSTVLNMEMLAPGKYSYYVVCSGGGEGTFVIGTTEAETVTLKGECNDKATGGDFSTSTTGTTITGTFAPALPANSPANWAVAVTEPLPAG